MPKTDISYQAVFFDFDGVILDSVNVKTEAFAAMFEQYGEEVVTRVVDYHLENGGVSRFEKFKFYYEKILDTELTEKTLMQLGDDFSRLVLDKVLLAPFIKGAGETLRLLKAKNIPAYVASGTPDEEIKYIVKEKGLSDFFQGVHGSPRLKQKIIERIISEKGYSPSLCLFIGDAMTDYSAANITGVPFLGIVPEDKPSPFPEGTTITPEVNIYDQRQLYFPPRCLI